MPRWYHAASIEKRIWQGHKCYVIHDVISWMRPQLRDPSDEMVLEAAVNGGADALVTFNQRDYGNGPALFGIEVLFPREALRRIRK